MKSIYARWVDFICKHSALHKYTGMVESFFLRVLPTFHFAMIFNLIFILCFRLQATIGSGSVFFCSSLCSLSLMKQSRGLNILYFFPSPIKFNQFPCMKNVLGIWYLFLDQNINIIPDERFKLQSPTKKTKKKNKESKRTKKDFTLLMNLLLWPLLKKRMVTLIGCCIKIPHSNLTTCKINHKLFHMNGMLKQYKLKINLLKHTAINVCQIN